MKKDTLIFASLMVVTSAYAMNSGRAADGFPTPEVTPHTVSFYKLYNAINRGEIEEIQAILEEQPEKQRHLLELSDRGCTPLYLAVNLARQLLNPRISNWRFKRAKWRNVVRTIFEFGGEAAKQSLATPCGYGTNDVPKEETVTHHATFHGDIEILKILHELGGEYFQQTLTMKDWNEDTPEKIALERTEVLSESNVNWNEITRITNYTPEASEFEETVIGPISIEEESDGEGESENRWLKRNRDGMTPLYKRVKEKNSDCVLFLLSQSYDSEKIKESLTVLCDKIPDTTINRYFNAVDIAAYNSDIEMLQILYKHAKIQFMQCLKSKIRGITGTPLSHANEAQDSVAKTETIDFLRDVIAELLQQEE